MTPAGGRQRAPLADLSDRELMAAHVAGDPDAFGELVSRHTSRLWAVAVRTLRDPEEAADALQDAMVSAFRGAGSYRGEAAVTTWLHRVVVNACLDRMRRAKARPSVPLPERDIAQPGDAHSVTVTLLDLSRALQQLPAAQRLAIVLVDLQELSVAEAAAVLDVAEGTVKSRCARGRAALAVLMRASQADGDVEGEPAGPGATGNPTEARRVTPEQARQSPMPTAPAAAPMAAT